MTNTRLDRSHRPGHRIDRRHRCSHRRPAWRAEGVDVDRHRPRRRPAAKRWSSEIVGRGGSARFVAADLNDLDSGPPPRRRSRARWTCWSTTPASSRARSLVDQDVECFDAAFASTCARRTSSPLPWCPGMVARGSGSIVNVSTMAACVGMAGLSTYGATKAARRVPHPHLGCRARWLRHPGQHRRARPDGN